MSKITKKILLNEEGSSFYILDPSKDYHTKFGFVSAKDLKKKDGSIVKTNLGKEFFVLSVGNVDSYRRIKRLAQIIPLKDVGSIVVSTGIDNKSVIVDAGTGSGALALMFSRFVKKVISYEIRKDCYEVAQENVKNLEVKNVVLKNKDFFGEVDEKNVDLVVLDLAEPWNGVENAKKILKIGGFLVSYSPTTPQVSDFVEKVRQTKGLIYLRTIEIIERDWEVDSRVVRPKSQQIGHSGFLSFVRRIF